MHLFNSLKYDMMCNVLDGSFSTQYLQIFKKCLPDMAIYHDQIISSKEQHYLY